MNIVTDLDRVIAKYPDLELFHKNNVPYKLQGPLEIYDSKGINRGCFEVQIFIPTNYPHGFPVLKEISNKIPKIADRHINNDGSCCVTITQKQCIEANNGITLERYIEKYVIPYFANQIFYIENDNKWANGEYYHGPFGQMQYYVELFNTYQLRIILAGINLALSGNIIDGNSLCFCGKNKFKLCHKKVFKEIKQIGLTQLHKDFLMVNSFILMYNNITNESTNTSLAAKQ